MEKVHYFWPLFLFIHLLLSLPAQANLRPVISGSADSLEYLLRNTVERQEKLRISMQLVRDLQNNYPDKALNFAREAMEIAVSLNDNQGRLEAMTRMADIYRATTEYKKAMEHAMEAKELATRLGDMTGLAETHRVIAGVFLDLGEYKQSSDHFFKNLKLAEMTGDTQAIARVLNNIGILYFEQQNNEKALEYYIRALEMSRRINDQNGISRGLNNVAAIHFEQNRNDSAAKYILEAVAINKKIGQRLWEGINYINLGEIKMQQRRYGEAYDYYDQAAKIYIEMNSMVKLAGAYLNLADLFSVIGNDAKSLDFAVKAYNIGKENGLKKVVMKAAEKLHKLYLKKKDLQNAYHYGMISYQVKDSLGLEESMIKLTKMEMQYDFEKNNQERQQKQQRKDFFIIIIIISLVTLILLILLFMARQKIKARDGMLARQKLQADLDFKNKEITINMMNFIRKNEIIIDISNHLLEIEKEAEQEKTKDSLLRIAGDLQKSIDVEIWGEFELRFKQVHGDFYERLTQRFPDLSPSELKLCAFLRLNLTTKDISKLTGQQITSLEIARHRLRTKLGISNPQTNLISFIAQV
jgi:tetratricopeptide (TPR) repeat protein